jgi:predicted ATP-binding protein involved in virulence
METEMKTEYYLDGKLINKPPKAELELLYVWIKDFKNIHEQGFSFSPSFDIHFDLNQKEVIINEGTNLDNDFFGNSISNITAIVGENGAGKSSIIEFLLHYVLSHYRYFRQDFLVVYRNKVYDIESSNEGAVIKKKYSNKKESIFIWYSENIVNEIKTIANCLIPVKPAISYSPKKESQKSILDHTLKANLLSSKLPIYYCNTLDKAIYSVDGIDLSTDYLMRGGDINKRHQPKEEQLLLQKTGTAQYMFRYQAIDLKRQMDFILNSDHKEIPFNLPEQIQIFASTFSKTDLGKIIGVGFPVSIERLSYKISERLESDVLANFWESVLAYYFKVDIQIKGKQGVEYYNKKVQEILDTSEPQKSIKALFKDNTTVLSFLEDFEDLINKKMLKEEGFQRDSYWIIEKKDWGVLHELTKKHPIALDFLLFSWYKQSTGEIAFLKLFSRLYEVKDQIKGLEFGAYIILDEAETAFHPQWQKKYIDFLQKFINKLFSVPIHLILTSHSPFVVSDLPKENIIFLRKGTNGVTEVVDGVNKINTFGANIHTLFADAFFMEGGLIGEFAKKKIDIITKVLHNILTIEKRIDRYKEFKDFKKLSAEFTEKFSIQFDEYAPLLYQQESKVSEFIKNEKELKKIEAYLNSEKRKHIEKEKRERERKLDIEARNNQLADIAKPILEEIPNANDFIKLALYKQLIEIYEGIKKLESEYQEAVDKLNAERDDIKSLILKIGDRNIQDKLLQMYSLALNEITELAKRRDYRDIQIELLEERIAQLKANKK